MLKEEKIIEKIVRESSNPAVGEKIAKQANCSQFKKQEGTFSGHISKGKYTF